MSESEHRLLISESKMTDPNKNHSSLSVSAIDLLCEKKSFEQKNPDRDNRRTVEVFPSALATVSSTEFLNVAPITKVKAPSISEAVTACGKELGAMYSQHPYEFTAAIISLTALANPEVRSVISRGTQMLGGRVAFAATETAECLTNAPYKIRAYEWNSQAALTGIARDSRTGDIFVSARNAVAKLNGIDAVSGEERGFGTAFAVTKDGRFLTNWHVVEEQQTCKLVDKFGVAHKATVVMQDKTNDLAVLQLDSKLSYSSFKPVSLGKGLPPGFNKDKNLLVFGHPQGRQEMYMSRGARESVDWPGSKAAEEKGFSVVPVTTRPGNSGSPVFDRETGQVVGINRALPTDKDFNWKLTVVVPAEHGKTLLEKSWK